MDDDETDEPQPLDFEPMVGYATEPAVWAFRAGYAVAHAQAMARTLRRLRAAADVAIDTAGFAVSEARGEIDGLVAAHDDLLREAKGWV